MKGSEGLPVAVQVVALPFQEEMCLRVMKEIDLETTFYAEVPHPYQV
jgi:Asp-tRNA(Asn)/Glu-tRNA(Gln) amidotransferase A subunit family amidase